MKFWLLFRFVCWLVGWLFGWLAVGFFIRYTKQSAAHATTVIKLWTQNRNYERVELS